MKGKKLFGLVLGAAMIFSLASCGEANVDDQKEAIKKTLDASICVNTSSGSPLLAGGTTELSGDSNDALTVTTSQIMNVNGTKYTVELAWSWAEEFNASISGKEEVDATHEKISFVYPASDAEADGAATLVVNAKCGEQTGSTQFNVTLTKMSLIFDPMTIAELYATNEAGDNFWFLNAENKIITNHGQSFYYIAISGKLIYKAPDSNWGLLADGEKVVQLYRLDACSDNNVAVVGKYITCYGEIGNGYGNVQISFISKIEEMEDHSAIAEPSGNYSSVPEGINDSAVAADFKSFCSGIGNSLYTVTGIVSSNTSTFTPGSRFTFTLKVGEHTFTVAYDYHTAKEGGAAIGTEFQSVLTSAVRNVTSLTIKGTIRWARTDGTSAFGAEGAWQLVPFKSGDIVANA